MKEFDAMFEELRHTLPDPCRDRGACGFHAAAMPLHHVCGKGCPPPACLALNCNSPAPLSLQISAATSGRPLGSARRTRCADDRLIRRSVCRPMMSSSAASLCACCVLP